MATLYDEDGNPFDIDDSLLTGESEPTQERAPQTNAEFAAIRRANSDAKKAAAEADAAKKALAFYKAGIDPEKPGITSYFAKAYDGELTVEAIKAQAVADGILAEAAPDPQVAANQAALAAQQRISGAATSTMAAPDLDTAARQALDDAYKAGGMEGLTAAMAAMGISQQMN